MNALRFWLAALAVAIFLFGGLSSAVAANKPDQLAMSGGTSYDPLANPKVNVQYATLDEAWSQVSDTMDFMSRGAKRYCMDPYVGLSVAQLPNDQEREAFVHSAVEITYGKLEDGVVVMTYVDLQDQAQATLNQALPEAQAQGATPPQAIADLNGQIPTLYQLMLVQDTADCQQLAAAINGTGV